MTMDQTLIRSAPEHPRDVVTTWSDLLLRDGYVVIPNAVSPETLAAIEADLAGAFAQTPFCEGGFYGNRTKRFGRLLARSPDFAALVQHDLILHIAEHILGPWCDTVQLNLTQAIALYPGALPQLPHRDQDMWQGDVGKREYLVNVMWPFTDYTADNGATLIWPDSHGANATAESQTAPIVPEMRPGSALLFLGSTLHGAGGNRSDSVRRGAIVSYCLGWLKPYENQWLAYPPPVARRFSSELAALVGYRQHRPNLGNFEGQCPSILLDDREPADAIGAIDALRPDQQRLIDDYVAQQRAP